MITGVQDLYYNVQDMERAVAFYRDRLGMQAIEQSPYWSAMACGGLRIGLHWTGGDPVPAIPRDAHGAHAGATLTLRSDGIDGDERALRAGGVQILARLNEEWGKLVVFTDPDGNVLKLMQPT